jgi:hypothetical protein
VIPYDLPPKLQYDRSLGGLRQFTVDWFATPHTAVRIVPAFPFDTLCGLVFFLPPVIVPFLTG